MVHLKLEGLGGKDKALRHRLLFQVRDGHIVQAYGDYGPSAARAKIRGFKRAPFPGPCQGSWHRDDHPLQITIDIALDDHKVSGHWKSQEGSRREKGSLKGTFISWDELEKKSHQETWASRLGNLGNPYQPWDDIIDHMHDAKLKWVSELPTPAGRSFDARPKNQRPYNDMIISGGHGSPVVWKDKVFLATYEGHGPDYDWNRANLYRRDGGMDEKPYALSAHDVITCFDSRSGRHLWTRRFQKKGLPFIGFNKNNAKPSPHIDEKRIVFMGSGGWVYALKHDGTVLWETRGGPITQMVEERKSVMRARSSILGYDNFYSPVIIVDQMVIANDHLGSGGVSKNYQRAPSGLIGIDANTGKKRWHQKACTQIGGSPRTWTHKGKHYIVVTTLGYVRLMDPKNGTILWSHPTNTIKNTHTRMVYENELYLSVPVPGTADEHNPTDLLTVACFDISLRGLKERWRLPPKIGNIGRTMPAVHGDAIYLPIKWSRRTKVHKEGGNSLVVVHRKSGDILKQFTKKDIPNPDTYEFAVGGGPMVMMGSKILIDRDNTHGVDSQSFLKHDKETLHILGPNWKAPNDTSYSMWIYPALADQYLYIRSRNEILCFDVSKKKRWCPPSFATKQ